MTMSRGKRFEENFAASLEELQDKGKDIAYLRLIDPGFGYRGVNNPSDFLVFKKPNLYFIELKERATKSINFKASLSEAQLQKMKDYAKHEGVVCGVLFRFSETEDVYFVDINKFEEGVEIIQSGKNKGKERSILTINGKKSMTPEEMEEVGVYVKGVKKVTNWRYDIGALIQYLETTNKG